MFPPGPHYGNQDGVDMAEGRLEKKSEINSYLYRSHVINGLTEQAPPKLALGALFDIIIGETGTSCHIFSEYFSRLFYFCKAISLQTHTLYGLGYKKAVFTGKMIQYIENVDQLSEWELKSLF